MLFESAVSKYVLQKIRSIAPPILLLLSAMVAHGSTLTIQTNILGPTPQIIGYNFGHFDTNSNTADWWRYSGVTGGRVFISPTQIEPKDELPPWGDGVTDQASFISRKALVRSNPWNTNYFNWGYVTNRYATFLLTGSDSIIVNYSCSQLRSLGVQILVASTATASKFTNVVAWGDQWELWHFYYEQAFYLGAQFDVQRYQMYNEPNDGGPTGTNYLTRLQLASDAVQSAIADVNAMYGKSLTPQMCGPVTAGTANSTYSTWGELVVTNRHLNYLGQTDPNFELIQDYDYHQYGSGGSPSSFGTDLASLQSQLAATMSPETPFPTVISEFNVYDGSQFNTLTTSLDSPVNYSAFGSIAVNLLKNFETEMYCFKFSQTVGAGYAAKNGMHYVDNTNAPYNIGGITKAGEVWRLINKGFSPGRNRLNFSTDSGTSVLDAQASYDPATKRYYLLSVNNTSSTVTWNAGLSALNLPTNNQVLLEEVSENCYGAGVVLTNIGANLSLGGAQPSNSVWLFTIPSAVQQPIQNFAASDAAQVSDGSNAGINYNGSANLVVKNNSTNAAFRSTAFIKFKLPYADYSNLQMAVLTLNAASASGSSNVEAHVYGITNNSWSQNTLTWANAPSLSQGISAGINYTNNYVSGIGTSAQLAGQLVANSVSSKKMIDVTSFLKNHAGTNISFMVARLVRFYGDTQNGDGISISNQGNLAPQLQLIFNSQPQNATITNIRTNGNKSVTLTFQGSPGQTYRVQAKTNLAVPAWTTLVTNLIGDTNGIGTYTDTQAANFSSRYYRTATP